MTVVTLALLAGSAVGAAAQAPAEVAFSGGAGLLVAEGGPWMSHLRIGPEWVPEKGFGFAADGGWLWFGSNPDNGGLTLSPSLVYSLGGKKGVRTTLRTGYSLLYREGAAHAVHAGLAMDYDIGPDKRLRFEVRDTFLPSAHSLHILEVTFGLILPFSPS
jgi:hypothetical protein